MFPEIVWTGLRVVMGRVSRCVVVSALAMLMLCGCGACDRDTPPPDVGPDADVGMDSDGDVDVEDEEIACEAPEIACEGECVTADSVAHCGGCVACEGGDNTVPRCEEGACRFDCEDGFEDQDGDKNLGSDGSGCECALSGELCDGVDNDCDGDVDGADEDFELSSCGDLAGAQASACEGGSCVFECVGGAVDLNEDLGSGLEGDGCECVPTEPADEVCDGVDNDCDGDVDAADEDFIVPLCGVQDGVCQGSQAVCVGGEAQVCDEAVYLANDALFTGLPGSLELLCDERDNNCDGQEDELCCGQGEGDVLLDEPLVENTRQILPAVAVADSGELFVAWQESSDNDSDDVADTGVIRWAIVGRDGQIVVGPQTRDTSDVEDIQPAVAFDGTAFVMVWVKGSANDVMAWLRIGTDGQVLEGPRDVVSDVQNDLVLRDASVVALETGEILMAWSQRTGCTNTQAASCIRMQEVSGMGIPEDPIEISESTGAIEARTPSIVLKEDRVLITWHDNALSQLGVKWRLLDDENIRSSTLNDRNLGILPTSAPTPGGFLLAFADSVDNTLQIHTLNLDNDAISLGDPVSITSGGDDKTHPQLAVLDDGLALVWVEDGNTVDLNSLDLNGTPEPETVSVLQTGTLGFRPVVLTPIEGIGTAFLHSSAPQFSPERLLFSILNAQGDRLCFGQE